MFSLRLNEPRALTSSILVISDFISEASFTITKEGIKLVAMDPANISMVILTILPSAFTEYKVEEPAEITVNLNNLKQALRRAKQTDSLALALEKNKLILKIAGKSTKRFFIPLLEKGGKERKVPSLEFAAKAEVDAAEFRDYIEDASIVADALAFEAEKGSFTILAGDAGSKVSIKLTKEAGALVQLAVSQPAKAIYSVEYLKKMARAASLADTAIIRFSKDYPLKLDFRSVDKLQMSFILAPRIENK